jgi:hypothetical protein
MHGSKRIKKDLAGLPYASTVKGFAEHPLFGQRVRERVAAAQPGGDIAARVPAAPVAAHGAPADRRPCGSGAGRAGSLAGDRDPGACGAVAHGSPSHPARWRRCPAGPGRPPPPRPGMVDRPRRG